MQNKATISYLKFFHGVIKFGKGTAILMIIVTIIQSVYQPFAIDIPVQYKLENAGHINLENSENNKVWLFEGEGRLKYKANDDLQFTSMAAFNILYSLFIAVAGFLIYSLLEKIVSSTLNEKPFSHENANRMTWLGYILIGVGILSAFYKIVGLIFLDINFTSAILTQESFGIQFMKYSIELLFNRASLLGFFALLIAQILRYGIELKEETELTI